MKIARKLALAFLLLSIIPLAAISVVLLREMQSSIEAEVTERLQALNHVKRAQIGQWTDSLQLAAESLAVRERIGLLSTRLMDETRGQEEKVLLQEEMRVDLLAPILDSSELFEILSIVDARTGRVLASTDAAAVGRHNLTMLAHTSEGARSDVGELVYHFTRNRLELPVVAPIRVSGDVIAFLDGRADLSFLAELLTGYETGRETEDLYLVNGSGFFITEPRFGDGSYALQRTVRNPATQAAAQGKRGTLIYESYLGTPVLGAYDWVDELSVGLISEVSTVEAFAPVRRMRAVAFAATGVALIAFAILGIWAARILARPIGRLSEGVRLLSGGAFTHRINSTRRDELGDLSRAFDRMVDDLQRITASRDELDAEIKRREVAEQKRKEIMTELERSNEDLAQFAYAASHDLQEPLRMVSSYVELLRKRYADHLDESGQEFIAFAVDGSMRMQKLIQDLLLLSRVQTGGVQREQISLVEALEEARALLAAAIEDTNADITADELPVIWGDQRRMTQLFQNLLGNALKFRGDDPPRIHVGAVKREAEWEISVADNGIGLDPRHAKSIFTVFKRLHTKQEYPGTGIGLALCKRIVEQHRGRIWVESALGQGTTFRFTIPFRTREDEE